MFRYFDAHTHAQFAAFDSDRDDVISRALSAGVGMINVGTQEDTSRAAVALAHRRENVYATVGLHPIHTSRSYHDSQELGGGEAAVGFTSRGEEFDYDYYKNLAADPKVVAIGECGLDYAAFVREERERGEKRASADLSAKASASAEALSEGGLPQEDMEVRKKKQKQVFLRQIELAHEVGKPLMIHCRSAFGDLIGVLNFKLKILNSPPGVIHFFSGTPIDAKILLDMGFYFTFGGVITFARDYDKVIEMIPSERILSETDAPYVAPAPYRGKRNEPLYVIEVVKKLAELKNLSVEAMAAQILKNAEAIFNLKLTTS